MSSSSLVQRNEILQKLRNKCDYLWQSKLTQSAPESPMNALWEEHLEIRQQLKEIFKLQEELGAVVPKANDRQQSLIAFMNWCDRMKIKRNNVTVKYFDNIGFELQTTGEVKEGEDMVTVPRNALLSWDLARKSVLLKKCFERDIIVRSMDNVALALMLCCQKLSSDSFWHPYFNILPETFDTPLYYSENELQALKPSPAFEDALLLFRDITRQFLYFMIEVIHVVEYRSAKLQKKQQAQMHEPTFLNTPLTPENFTFDLYRWSVACVSTRINMIPSQDLRNHNDAPVLIPCLIPLLDMANHEVCMNASLPHVYFSAENDCASITAVRNYNAGETVRIYYGKRCSSDFLLHNGFVPESDSFEDTCKLKIGITKKSEFYNARLKMMQDYGYTTNSNIFHFDLSLKEPYVDESLLYFARVFVLNNPDENGKSQLETYDVTLKAWDFLRKRLELTLSTYGKLDNIKPATSREATILRLKRNEVKVLRKAFHYSSEQYLKLLSQSQQEGQVAA
uniref:protein-histidine N-methyltransferase n=1 Tax=Syphacia muris TaxID=451379 RepID=A0A0N5AN47_9BILA